MDLFGTTIVNVNELLELLVRFTFNLLVSVVIVRVLYYQTAKRKDYLFTFFLIGTIVFLLCYLLANVNLQLGFALGLFAIFGIIRYRTTQIPIKEMTYLFLTIGIAVINALGTDVISYAELVVSNLLIISITYTLEKIWWLKHESSKLIIYEKIELIKSSKKEELLKDLRDRTELPIHRYEVGKVNFLRDTAQIIVYYYTNDISNAEMGSDSQGEDD